MTLRVEPELNIIFMTGEDGECSTMCLNDPTELAGLIRDLKTVYDSFVR